MDGMQFDSWTRRRFGLAAGGFTAASLSLLAPERGRAKNKKKCKKIRCRQLQQTCEPDSKEQSCCQGLNCDPVSGLGLALFCCLGRQQPCQTTSQCCGSTICSNANGPSGLRCCGFNHSCATNGDCCSGYDCVNNECAAQSDRTLKANFGSVDPADMLQRVRDLPITAWHDAGGDPAIRHIEPMAQDFASILGVGADDPHIHPIDGQGVALAAIQGLSMETERLRAGNAILAARLTALESTRSVLGR